MLNNVRHSCVGEKVLMLFTFFFLVAARFRCHRNFAVADWSTPLRTSRNFKALQTTKSEVIHHLLRKKDLKDIVKYLLDILLLLLDNIYEENSVISMSFVHYTFSVQS